MIQGQEKREIIQNILAKKCHYIEEGDRIALVDYIYDLGVGVHIADQQRRDLFETAVMFGIKRHDLKEIIGLVRTYDQARRLSVRLSIRRSMSPSDLHKQLLNHHAGILPANGNRNLKTKAPSWCKRKKQLADLSHESAHSYYVRDHTGRQFYTKHMPLKSRGLRYDTDYEPFHQSQRRRSSRDHCPMDDVTRSQFVQFGLGFFTVLQSSGFRKIFMDAGLTGHQIADYLKDTKRNIRKRVGGMYEKFRKYRKTKAFKNLRNKMIDEIADTVIEEALKPIVKNRTNAKFIRQVLTELFKVYREAIQTVGAKNFLKLHLLYLNQQKQNITKGFELVVRNMKSKLGLFSRLCAWSAPWFNQNWVWLGRVGSVVAFADAVKSIIEISAVLPQIIRPEVREGKPINWSPFYYHHHPDGSWSMNSIPFVKQHSTYTGPINYKAKTMAQMLQESAHYESQQSCNKAPCTEGRVLTKSVKPPKRDLKHIFKIRLAKQRLCLKKIKKSAKHLEKLLRAQKGGQSKLLWCKVKAPGVGLKPAVSMKSGIGKQHHYMAARD
jgi:hypothetical protein